MEFNKLKTYFFQFRDTILTNSEAIIFIRKNRLWEGFWQYGWVAKTLVVLAVLLGLKLLNTFLHWWRTSEMDNPVETLASFGNLFQDVAVEGFDFLFVGGMKYIMMMLLEVIIFHVCRGALEILTGKTSDLSFNAFFNAQIRMIKVAIRSYFMEIIFSVIIAFVLGIFGGAQFLKPVLKYTVHCYFLGFIVFDNYAEQFGLTIKESVRMARNYVGVCLALGLTTNVLLLLPVVGAILAPLIVAVTVTLVMYHISDLHLLSQKDDEQALSPA